MSDAHDKALNDPPVDLPHYGFNEPEPHVPQYPPGAAGEPPPYLKALNEPPIRLTYKNWRGEVAERSIIPRSLRFASTEWHPEPQWLLLAYDTEKGADREFALKDFSPPATDLAAAEARASEYAKLVEQQVVTIHRAEARAVEAERQRDIFRAVLEAAGYQNIDSIRDVENATHLGATVAGMTIGLRNTARRVTALELALEACMPFVAHFKGGWSMHTHGQISVDELLSMIDAALAAAPSPAPTLDGFTYYWCEDCDWDSVRSRDNIKGPCPMCAGDNGGDGRMNSKPCPADQGKVEGRDDRAAAPYPAQEKQP